MPKSLQTWQLWHSFKKTLGESFLMQVMGKSNARTIRLYSQNPLTTDDRCKDPLQALHIIFSELDEIGRGDLARRAIDYLSTAVDCEGETGVVMPLKGTMDAEKLADFQRLGRFHGAIDDGADVDLVETLMNEAKEEIERTYAKYLEG